ncbi:unnamed protein product, partial [Rotaria sp. Silwood1]
SDGWGREGAEAPIPPVSKPKAFGRMFDGIGEFFNSGFGGGAIGYGGGFGGGQLTNPGSYGAGTSFGGAP